MCWQHLIEHLRCSPQFQDDMAMNPRRKKGKNIVHYLNSVRTLPQEYFKKVVKVNIDDHPL